MDTITDEAELRAHLGPVHPVSARKVLPCIDHHARAFIALSPLLILASASAGGAADASPRGDAPGFARVLDDRTLLLPERPGNNRADSFANIVARPGVGLLFLVPGIDETLRVNGQARVTADADTLADSAVRGRAPRLGLLIAVEEVFFHCGKALKRCSLWDPARHVPRAAFPTLGRIMADQTSCSVEAAEQRIEEGYRNRLY